VLKFCCSKANQKNYWVGWARSLELHSLENDPVAIFLYPQNGAFSMLILKSINSILKS
jgi:hypothetical protein